MIIIFIKKMGPAHMFGPPKGMEPLVGPGPCDQF